MWYRSNLTGKLIHERSSLIIGHIFGDGIFEKLITSGNLTPIDPPSVLDIMMETKSFSLAVVRYREIHGCKYREASNGVRQLLKEMRKNKKDPEVENKSGEDVLNSILNLDQSGTSDPVNAADHEAEDQND